MSKGMYPIHIFYFSRLSKVGLVACMCSFLLFTLPSSAQQDPLFSQYMFNRLIVNPGYAGSSNTINTSLAYRKQFIGLDGAPQIQGFTIDAPLKTKPMGLGLKAIHESIGATRQTEVMGVYAYHLNLSKGKLSLGAEGGIYNQAIDFSNLEKTVQDDNAIPLGKASTLVPDAAIGVYYSSEKLYIGGSFNHLLQNELNLSGYSGQDRSVISKLSSHSYLLAGYTIEAGENVQVEPSILLKYVSGAPVQLDLNVNATFKKMVTIGATYRTKNAIVFLFQYSFKERLKFGYAYDYIISELSSFGYNTHGVMLSYHIPSGEKEPKKEEDVETDSEIIATNDPIPEDPVVVPEDPVVVPEDPVVVPEDLVVAPEDPVVVPETPIKKDTDTGIEPTLEETSVQPPTNTIAESDTSAIKTQEDATVKELESTPNETIVVSTKEEKTTTPEKQPENSSNDYSFERSDVAFKIQLSATSNPTFLAPANFKGLENVEEYQEGGLYKYVVGLAYHYGYAKDVLLNEVRMQGFPDAFIVAFYRGTKISVQEALKLTKD